MIDDIIILPFCLHLLTEFLHKGKFALMSKFFTLVMATCKAEVNKILNTVEIQQVVYSHTALNVQSSNLKRQTELGLLLLGWKFSI